MLTKSYSNEDLEELTIKAHEMWEFDIAKKQIMRRQDAPPVKVPVQAIYRMTKEAWHQNRKLMGGSTFPFVESNFKRVLGLREGWSISVEDRKFIEQDMILFANDGTTVLITLDTKKWWESSWFNAVSIVIGIAGLVVGIISVA